MIVNSYGGSASSGGYSSVTIASVVPSGTNRLLIVTMDLWAGSTSGITFGGVALTQLSTGDWWGEDAYGVTT